MCEMTVGCLGNFLPPGKRSAFPHAHTHEEEFVYVLKGRPTVWMNGFSKVLSPDMIAAFPSNTGISHALINNTEEDVIYICIGEAKEFPEEKIVYPLNFLRKNECQRKGWYWNDCPKQLMGSDLDKSDLNLAEHLAFLPVESSDVNLVYEIFKNSERYFLNVDGYRPTMEMAKRSIQDGPPQKHADYFKDFLLIQLNGINVGVLDLHINHPDLKTCYLGLLLLQESYFGKGLGHKCYLLAEDYVKRAFGCNKVRLGVSELNQVGEFWKKMGFVPTGKSYLWQGQALSSNVLEFEKVIG